MNEEELIEAIIKSYMEYIDGELLEDNYESIVQYVSTLNYDLLDDIELNKELFGIPQSYEDWEAVECIEDYIEYVLRNKENKDHIIEEYGSKYVILLKKIGKVYKQRNFSIIKDFLKYNTVLHLGYGGRIIRGINDIEKYFQNEFDYLNKADAIIKTRINGFNDNKIKIDYVSNEEFEEKREELNLLAFDEDNTECLEITQEIACDTRKFIIIITLDSKEKLIENILIEKLSFYGLD